MNMGVAQHEQYNDFRNLLKKVPVRVDRGDLDFGESKSRAEFAA